MSDRSTTPAERPVHWIGSSKRDLLSFPKQVVSDMGYALGLAQLGGKHPEAKPWKGQGRGVFELVERHEGDAYRDVDLVAQRLRLAQEDYERDYGKRRAR